MHQIDVFWKIRLFDIYIMLCDLLHHVNGKHIFELLRLHHEDDFFEVLPEFCPEVEENPYNYSSYVKVLCNITTLTTKLSLLGWESLWV